MRVAITLGLLCTAACGRSAIEAYYAGNPLPTTGGSSSGTTGSSGGPCHSSADCPSLATACNGAGSCESVPCTELSNGAPDSGVGTACLMADGTRGSCLFATTAISNGFYCVLPGTADAPDGTCSATATRADLGDACSAGYACGLGQTHLAPPGTNSCWQECDPSSASNFDGCSPGFVACVASEVVPEVGYCVYGDGSSTSGSVSGAVSSSSGTGTIGGTSGGHSSTSTGAASGTGVGVATVGPSSGGSTSVGATTGAASGTIGGTTSSSGSGSTSGGMCTVAFTTCDPTTAGSCTCGQTCVFEALRQGFACEDPCTTTSECPTPFTVCTGVSCTINICGVAIGGPPNGTIDGTCNASGTNDGTCVGAQGADGGMFGVCYQGGTATGAGCSLTATRSDPSQLCTAGSFCGPSLMSLGQFTCYQLCNPNDPNANATCMTEGFHSCFAVPMGMGLGVCQ